MNGMTEANLVVVRAFHTSSEAEIAKTALDSAGIASLLQADSVGGMRPHIAWSGAGFKLLVREEDAAEAADILRPRPIAVQPDDV